MASTCRSSATWWRAGGCRYPLRQRADRCGSTRLSGDATALHAYHRALTRRATSRVSVLGPDENPLIEAAAADNLKRVRRPATGGWDTEPGLGRMVAFLETKTVWHPKGM